MVNKVTFFSPLFYITITKNIPDFIYHNLVISRDGIRGWPPIFKILDSLRGNLASIIQQYSFLILFPINYISSVLFFLFMKKKKKQDGNYYPKSWCHGMKKPQLSKILEEEQSP
jgi:hypothetical protein